MSESIHLQILRSLRASVGSRREDLRAKAGEGLADTEYQRHVGRIRECGVLLEEIERYLKNGLDAVEDEDELDEDIPIERTSRAERARRPSRTAS